MPTVELVYDADCPNVASARAQLLRAFARAGLPARWEEWWSDDPHAPGHVRGFGSPTVLVDGEDVAGVARVEGVRSCRLYGGSGQLTGVPAMEDIVASLLRRDRRLVAAEGHVPLGRTSAFATLPGLGVALLPKLACPACWPAYAGLLSSLGISFLLDARVLLPLTGAFLAIAVFALGFRASRRRGYGPFALGLVAAAAVLVGKFVLERDGATVGGLALLVAASAWNSWATTARAHRGVGARLRGSSSTQTGGTT